MGWDAARYAERHRYVADLAADLVDVLSPQPGEHILDLGSGTGRLTYEIAKRGAEVLGVDSSENMVETARATYPDLHFETADARSLTVQEPYDAVFSNAVLHWVREPEAAVQSIRGVLRAGGRLVAEFGGKGNVRAVVEALGEHPWYFPSISEYTSILERNGFEVRLAQLFDRPTELEGDDAMADWLEMFAGSVLNGRSSRELQEKIRSALYKNGRWTVDYRRLRVSAVAV